MVKYVIAYTSRMAKDSADNKDINKKLRNKYWKLMGANYMCSTSHKYPL